MKLLRLLLIVSIGTVSIGIVTYALVQSFGALPIAKASVTATTPASQTPPAIQPAVEAPSGVSVDGVTAEIVNVKRDNNSTIIALALNNHQFDLATFDATARTKLANVKPTSYRVLQSASGGHHVQSELTFPGILRGTLTLGLGDTLTFALNVP